MTAVDIAPPAAARRTYHPLLGVLGANTAVWSATRLLSLALPWFVLSITGSAAETGLVMFCQMAPYVVSQVLSGPVIDRVGPRRISIACDLVSLTALGVAPVLHFTGALPLWALALLVAVVGIADGPSNAAKSVFVPAVARAAHVPLERAAGLNGAVERTATLIGPAVAGLVIAMVGGAYALWIAAALFGLGGLIVALALRGTDSPAREGEEEGYVARLRQGARFLRREGLLRSITGMIAATNLLDQAFMVVLLPFWAKASGYGPEAVGLVVSGFAATSIVSSLAAAAIGDRLPRRIVYLAGYVLGGIPRFAVMALGAPLWMVVAVFAVGGLGSGFINPIIGAINYERIPAHLLARVRTMSGAVAWSLMPFGGLLGGALIAFAGVGPALWIVGGLYLLAIVVPAFRREWADMDRRPARPVLAPEASAG